MIISGIFTIRNALGPGYPFIEAILSLMPAVDEFLINDGGSDDGTLKYLKKLGKQYEKIRIYRIQDKGHESWEPIDRSLNELIDESRGEWIIEGQGDEIWTNSFKLREILDETDYNSLRQPRIEINSGYKMWTVRAVRNLPDLTSYEGGDSFHLGEHGKPTEGYSNHCVPPELKKDFPFYHYSDQFRENIKSRRKRHAIHLARDRENRRKMYEKCRDNERTEK